MAMSNIDEIPAGYKRTAVGVIPSEWKIEKLSSLFPKIRNGFVGTATPFYVEQGVKYLQGKNIKNGKIISEDIVYVSQEFHEKQQKSRLSLGDIVMVQSGHVGECAVINDEYINSNCHALIIMTPKDKVNSYYYSYLFNSDYGKKLFYKIKTGNTVEHILASDMNKLKVPVPDFAEQNKIADILSTWDKAIELKEKLIEQKKEQKKGLMQNLLTGKIRWNDGSNLGSKEINKRLEMLNEGKVPDGYKKVKWFSIPWEWSFEKIGNIAEEVSITNKDNKEYTVLSIKSVFVCKFPSVEK
ncbi:restriction endonuclease subunit S [Brevibacillus sp. WF146]|uniref:restriction endonuclease subunit S n=1 Tax=Brevibacillus sp. WF146 TaxID=319501 RepID=UPI002226BEAC|nr:restriction endonuclease subunit S [Brevibacillus sp. WF146]UYZ14756.1 restriction endonuclease subunit S [Brevibacillus sp. WF146]